MARPTRFASARARRRFALTLVELVVVIAILTILGGLIVQGLPGMMNRTHLSKCSDTIASLNKIWGESYALHARYPDNYDSLLGAGGGGASDKLVPALSSLISPTTLSTDEATALAAIGVRNVVDLSSSAKNVTYDCAPLGAASRTLSGGQVALLTTPGSGSSAYWDANPLGLKRHLDTTLTVKYVAFGIGPNCTGVGAGKLMQEAPVHFAANDTINPALVYQRYLAIFSLATNSSGVTTAYFEAAAGDDTVGPSSAEGHIRQFYDGQSRGE